LKGAAKTKGTVKRTEVQGLKPNLYLCFNNPLICILDDSLGREKKKLSGLMVVLREDPHAEDRKAGGSSHGWSTLGGPYVRNHMHYHNISQNEKGKRLRYISP